MSETPVGSTMLSRLEQSLVSFTEAIGASVADICSYGLTIGESYVPFDPDPDDDCDEDDVSCSQIWVRVDSINPNSSPGGWGGDCALTLSMDIEVGVLRCIQIPEDGEAPTASDVAVAALQNLEDMNNILCAAMATEVWDEINVGTWVPTGPLGGQFGGIWTFTVEI